MRRVVTLEICGGTSFLHLGLVFAEGPRRGLVGFPRLELGALDAALSLFEKFEHGVEQRRLEDRQEDEEEDDLNDQRHVEIDVNASTTPSNAGGRGAEKSFRRIHNERATHDPGLEADDDRGDRRAKTKEKVAKIANSSLRPEYHYRARMFMTRLRPSTHPSDAALRRLFRHRVERRSRAFFSSAAFASPAAAPPRAAANRCRGGWLAANSNRCRSRGPACASLRGFLPAPRGAAPRACGATAYGAALASAVPFRAVAPWEGEGSMRGMHDAGRNLERLRPFVRVTR